MTVVDDLRAEVDELVGVDPAALAGGEAAQVPWSSEAELERVGFDGQGRVTDVGPRRRFSRGATRRAVQLRDRRCFHPVCDQPAEHCELDHNTAFSDGGPTTQANGQPACAFHNRWKHKNPHRVDRSADRHPDDDDGDDEQPAA